MTINRCTGHCCRSFYLPFSPKELREAYDRWYASQTGYPVHKTTTEPKDQRLYQDIHLVAPMVEHLGKFRKNPLGTVNDDGFGKERRHYYRCKLFDPKAKRCTIYEIRLRMCREYPYGNKCNYRGCTWKKVKAKRLTAKERREAKTRAKDAAKKLKNPGGKRT